MRKKVWLPLLILAVVTAGIYLYLKFNPPLETGTLAWGDDQKSVIVGIGNKGFQKIEVVEVLVNNDDMPRETKVQASNALLGFIIADDFHSEEAEEYNFKDLNEVVIETGTSHTSTMDKMNEGTATEDDPIYGVSVLSDEEIHKVIIKYSYFGIPMEEIVDIN